MIYVPQNFTGASCLFTYKDNTSYLYAAAVKLYIFWDNLYVLQTLANILSDTCI